jgi:predicted nuclease with TOPRIM domain
MTTMSQSTTLNELLNEFNTVSNDHEHMLKYLDNVQKDHTEMIDAFKRVEKEHQEMNARLDEITSLLKKIDNK